MAQINWVLLDYQDRPHRVGLYHGDQSGHVLIHCEMRVIKIDFSVLESKTYTFFLEEELCELRIVKEKTGFSYELVINKKSDTPLNRARKQAQRVELRLLLLYAALFLVVLGGAAGGLLYYGRAQGAKRHAGQILLQKSTSDERNRLLSEGLTAQAVLTTGLEYTGRRVYCLFSTAAGTMIRGDFPAPDTGQILLPNGFPLVERDTFSVRYLPESPDLFFVNFNEPAPGTIAAYRQRAGEAAQKAHPEARPADIRCLTETVLNEKGWAYLAHVLFQQKSPTQNPSHNRNTYRQMLADPALAKVLRETCGNR
ncbi:MAG: hypothetical protein ACR2K1_01820 [Saprospiraceae bacterium]